MVVLSKVMTNTLTMAGGEWDACLGCGNAKTVTTFFALAAFLKLPTKEWMVWIYSVVKESSTFAKTARTEANSFAVAQ
jgi:hypothetical protein